MTDFCVSIAGIPIGVCAIYPSTKTFFGAYLCCDPPAFCVGVEPQDIDYERAQSAAQDARLGAATRRFSDAYLETLAVLRKIADGALDYDAVLFHGSAVALDGMAYLFGAPSGAGKTTHAALWLKRFPRAYILNGDKPFLRIRDGAVYACGTPFMGKEQLGRNEILPLKAICFLQQAKENSIEPISRREALVPMLRQVYCPERKNGTRDVLQILKQIGLSVKLYSLKCNTDPDAALVSSSAILSDCMQADA